MIQPKRRLSDHRAHPSVDANELTSNGLATFPLSCLYLHSFLSWLSYPPIPTRENVYLIKSLQRVLSDVQYPILVRTVGLVYDLASPSYRR